MNFLGGYLQTVWADGDVKVPAQYFAAEPGLGICRTYTGTQSNFTIAQAGAAVAKFGSGGTTFAGTVTAPAFVGTGSIVDSKYVVATGNASLTVPSFVWAEDTKSGLSSDGAGNIGVVYQGTDYAHFGVAGLTMTSGGMVYCASNSNAGHPGFSFANDPDTGIYELTSPNRVAIACDSGTVAAFGTSGSTINGLTIPTLTVSGTSSMAGVTSSTTITVPIGLVTAPSIRFAGDTTSGLYSDSAGIIGITLSGVLAVDISSSLFYIAPTITAVNNLTINGTITATAIIPLVIGASRVSDFLGNGIVQIKRSELDTVTAVPSSGTTNRCLHFGTNSSTFTTDYLTPTYSAVNGDIWTIAQAGLYTFRMGGMTAITGVGAVYIGISRNIAGTTNFTSWTQAQTVGLRFLNSVSDIVGTTSWSCLLAAGDVIRCCAGGDTTLLTVSSSTWFEINYITGMAASL